jgi:hypothetical protein
MRVFVKTLGLFLLSIPAALAGCAAGAEEAIDATVQVDKAASELPAQAPVFQVPVYTPPIYTAPVFPAPVYQAPGYSSPTYVAPVTQVPAASPQPSGFVTAAPASQGPVVTK